MNGTASWEFVIDSVPHVIIITNHTGSILFANSQAKSMFGYEKEELIDQSVEVLIPERSRREHTAYREGYAHNPGPRSMGSGRDLIAVHRDGREFPVEVGLNPVKTDSGIMIVCVIVDISERKKSDEKIKTLNVELSQRVQELNEANDKLRSATEILIQAEKTSAVGTMVAGIAHQLNNPLMGIINGVQYGLRHTPTDDKRYKSLKLIEESTARCIDIVSSLRTFSQYGDIDEESYRPGHCGVIIDRVLFLTEYRVDGSGITIVKHVGEDPEISMKPNSLQQAFFNLLVNAIDAVEGSERKEISISLERKDGNVEITIEDTGPGIPPGILQKIFDPFFTTKAVGKGTGLGLSTSKNIVDQQGGELRCETRYGSGTKFTISLPVERQDGD